MRALLVSPLGFLIGLAMGAVGGGGSILALPVLIYLAGQDPRSATTASLVVVGIAAIAGMADHWRAGRVRPGVGVVFGLTGIGGSLAGSALNRGLDPDVLLLGLAAVMVLAAWRMLAAGPACPRGDEEPPQNGGGVAVVDRLRADPATVAKIVGAGTVVGFLTGLFGVGGGFLILPTLTLLLGFAMPQAVGTSLLVIAVNCAVALAGRAGDGIPWKATLPFAAAAVVGVLAGSHLADRMPARTLLRSFAALLVAVAVYTAGDAIISLT